ncbi:hypothetical protein AB0D97_08640 [Streptomyces roseus]|uniref:hypothetical protein n=1 Tax=Streptomyces roseus TaxID=66430 RepID=UPI0033D40401
MPRRLPRWAAVGWIVLVVAGAGAGLTLYLQDRSNATPGRPHWERVPSPASERLGHNGELPGYETIAAQLPEGKATLVVLVNSDIDHRGKNLSGMIGKAVTSVVTPDHLWPAPVATGAKKSPVAVRRGARVTMASFGTRTSASPHFMGGPCAPVPPPSPRASPPPSRRFSS